MDPLLLTPAEIERRVFSWLQSKPPATREDWLSLGTEGMKRLYSIAVTPRTGTRANRLRSAALGCLGKLGDIEHLEPLLAVFEEPDPASIVRCGAIEGLGHLGLPRALPLLQSQAYHPDFRVRLYSVAALARMPRALTRRLLNDISMRDPVQQVRRAAQVELDRISGDSTGGLETGPPNRDGAARTLEGEISAPPAPTLDQVEGTTLQHGERTEEWSEERQVC